MIGLDLLKEISFEGGKGKPEKNEEEAQRPAMAQAQMMASVIMKTQAGRSRKGGKPHRNLM